jgi:hypothetical protein
MAGVYIKFEICKLFNELYTSNSNYHVWTKDAAGIARSTTCSLPGQLWKLNQSLLFQFINSHHPVEGTTAFRIDVTITGEFLNRFSSSRFFLVEKHRRNITNAIM